MMLSQLYRVLTLLFSEPFLPVIMRNPNTATEGTVVTVNTVSTVSTVSIPTPEWLLYLKSDIGYLANIAFAFTRSYKSAFRKYKYPTFTDTNITL